MATEIREETPAGAAASPSSPRREWRGMALVFLVALALHTLLSLGPPTPYNAHVRLAEAWLLGQVTPPDLPSHIEHVPGPTGAILPYGPGPSLLLLPLVAIWGGATDQSAFCMALGAVNVALAWSLLGRLGTKGSLRLALTLLFGIGSPHLFTAVQSGNTWPMMHVVTVFGLLVALRAALGARSLGNAVAAGLGLGLAYLTRQPALFAVPFVALLLWERPVPWKRGLAFGSAFGACVAFAMAYNGLRMGSPFDTGYERVVMAITPAHFLPFGLFSPEYVARNLQVYFLSGPERIAAFPYVQPSQYHMSMLLVFPGLLLMPLADWRERRNWLMLGAIASMMAVYLGYYWTGATQFGMRYAVDWLPFALVLIASAGQRSQMLVWLAAALGVGVEVWGLSMWRLLGWG